MQLNQTLRNALLAAALVAAPLAAQTPYEGTDAHANKTAGAQQTAPATNPGQVAPANNPMNQSAYRDNSQNMGFNPGWLGLVGLAGLFGLFRSPRRADHHEQDHDMRPAVSRQ